MNIPITRALLALGAASFAACDRPPAPVGVEGRVMLDAQPIPEGRIEFVPVPGSLAQHRDAEIRNGNYQLPDVEGLSPGGEFRVRIKAFRKTGKQFPAPDGMTPFDEYEQYLPDQFHSASDLRIVVHSDRQRNHFDFQLDSKAQPPSSHLDPSP